MLQIFVQIPVASAVYRGVSTQPELRNCERNQNFSQFLSVGVFTGHEVIQYIQSDLTKKITLPDLAKLTGLSHSYLLRLIKKETGSSLVNLVDSYRMEEGKYLLLNSDYSIMQIAELTGFNYQYHFALRFKKYTGMTPTTFRLSGGVKT